MQYTKEQLDLIKDHFDIQTQVIKNLGLYSPNMAYDFLSSQERKLILSELINKNYNGFIIEHCETTHINNKPVDEHYNDDKYYISATVCVIRDDNDDCYWHEDSEEDSEHIQINIFNVDEVQLFLNYINLKMTPLEFINNNWASCKETQTTIKQIRNKIIVKGITK